MINAGEFASVAAAFETAYKRRGATAAPG